MVLQCTVILRPHGKNRFDVRRMPSCEVLASLRRVVHAYVLDVAAPPAESQSRVSYTRQLFLKSPLRGTVTYGALVLTAIVNLCLQGDPGYQMCEAMGSTMLHAYAEFHRVRG